MSPFTCSLVALAALLAAARAVGSNCNHKDIGYTHPCTYPIDYNPVPFRAPGQHVPIPTHNCPGGMEVVGEQLEACNNDVYGPPPNINGPPPGQFTPVDVSCSKEECPTGAVLNIRQCCNYPTRRRW